MRTLLLILLCLIILAPGASARKQKDDSSDDSTATVQSSSNDTKDKSSDSSSKSSSDSSSSYKPAESKSDSDSGSHPTAKRDDPPPTVVRSEPTPEPPKPVEETHQNSSFNAYHPSNPDPEPVRYTPPTPIVSESSSSSDSSTSISRKEAKQREKAAEQAARSDNTPAYNPHNSTEQHVTVKSSEDSSATATQNGSRYHPITTSHKGDTTPSTSTGSNTPYGGDTQSQPKIVDVGNHSAYHPKPGSDSGNTPPSGTATTVTTHDLTYHPSNGSNMTNNTGYKPADTSHNSPKKQAKLDQRAKDAQAKAQQDAVRSSHNPGPPAGYTPSGKMDKPGGPTFGHGGNPTGNDHSGGFHPGNGTWTGHNPTGNIYKVGYHPVKPSKPHDYRPPTVHDGRWTYHTPPFVEDRHWHFKRPCYFGHWADDYYPGFSWRSFYFYFGVYPYVEVTSIRECPQETIEFVSEPIYVSGRSYVREARWDRIDEALADIRSAWIGGRFDLLQRHVQPNTNIAVLIDGQYDYSISSNDYLNMTEDALADLNTVSFVWNKVRERSDGTVMAFADHSYWSNDRAKTVYVSYTFAKIGRDYFITEIGSSENPLN